MKVRAKFTCISKTQELETGHVSLQPVIADSPENASRFFRWTPAGAINLVLNPSALAQFEVGEDYYVDFTKAE